MTTGSLLVARASMKPLATLNRPVLRTVDVNTKEETVSFKERTDVTAVPAAGVVAETMVALGPRRRGDPQVRWRLDARAHAQPPRVRRVPVSAKHLVLIGLMGAGKTTVGRRGAEALGRGFVDTDELITANAGATVPEIFAAEGETGFRRASVPRSPTRSRRRSRWSSCAAAGRWWTPRTAVPYGPTASSSGSRAPPTSSRRGSSATAPSGAPCWRAAPPWPRSPDSPTPAPTSYATAAHTTIETGHRSVAEVTDAVLAAYRAVEPA